MKFKKSLQMAVCLIVIFQSVSCNSQSTNSSNIQGNWFPEYLGDINEAYTEFYIDDTSVYYFNPTSETISTNEYYITNSKLYFGKDNGDSAKLMGTVSIKNDTLTIVNEAGNSSFLKQNELPSLEDLINDDTSLDIFFEGYINREAVWNENKYKP
ncbi:hypothetical protein K1F50_18560 [Muricauda oceani]|uniref:Lipocalin-like domain-containing protein n=1 Tax=Flagellimonas oceani TaxID=2698672 RepID=A0A6G7IZ39_9FLAO|nr:hypothetical protein [Allomuricauda oceani]MBW8244817.1 hypothetical protein [Allomuricauda oceani]QII43871.1 hypothetical protein GVT53_04000 [Allomuricauda oceani]